MNGGGVRFREVKKEHDYNNFKFKSTKIEKLDIKYINNELEKISEIEIENIYLSFNN